MKKTASALILTTLLILSGTLRTYAETEIEGSETEEEVSAVVETNEIPNWPAGPDLNAESAFLFEANTGVILYAKNIHEHLYPASTTKIMTALLAAEHCKMDEIVNFSHDAVFSLESGSSNIGIDPGQSMPMEECLYGIMVASANEVANAVAEHVAGDMDSFVKMMNDKAGELDLQDTHFTNANGLFNEEHYTSAYDLGMIAREYFKNERLSRIGNTPRYHFVASPGQPDDFWVKNKHELVNGDIPYEGLRGGKTGYTSEAGETLVTCAEANGLKLICVILKEESPDQFYDTVKLFDYGFGNFTVMNVADNEMKYTIESNNFFPTNVDILGNSEQILTLDEDNYIIMPKNIGFDDLQTEVSYDTTEEDEIAYIRYSYNGAYLGYGTVNVIGKKKHLPIDDNGITISSSDVEDTAVEPEIEPLFINVVNVITYVVAVSGTIMIVSFLYSFVVNTNFLDRFRRHKRTRRRHRGDRKITF